MVESAAIDGFLLDYCWVIVLDSRNALERRKLLRNCTRWLPPVAAFEEGHEMRLNDAMNDLMSKLTMRRCVKGSLLLVTVSALAACGGNDRQCIRSTWITPSRFRRR